MKKPLPPVGIALPIDVATPAPAKDPTEFNDSIQLPKNNVLRDKLIAAEDYIKIQDWVQAILILQNLVSQDSDVFAQVPRKGQDGKETLVWTSVKTEANRLLGGLPADGKKYYESDQGPNAAAILKAAKQTGDPKLLGDLMKRYLHTEAGAEATDLLATGIHLDRGDYTIASHLLRVELLNREGTEKVAPLTLFKAAYAFHQIGTAEDKVAEEQIWTAAWARVEPAAPAS